jgi:hypothetical protein
MSEEDLLFHTLAFHGSLNSWSEPRIVKLVDPDVGPRRRPTPRGSG